jgi:hypothetical protein
MLLLPWLPLPDTLTNSNYAGEWNTIEKMKVNGSNLATCGDESAARHPNLMCLSDYLRA